MLTPSVEAEILSKVENAYSKKLHLGLLKLNIKLVNLS